MTSKVRQVREKAERALKKFPDAATEVLSPDRGGEIFEKKFALINERLKKAELAKKKFTKSPTANAVFGTFAKDAAELTVEEMYTAEKSKDRQNAANTVLDRALGKAVDRSISYNLNVNDMTIEEIDSLLHEFTENKGNATGTEGGVTPLILDEKAEDSGEQTITVKAKPRMARKIRKKSSKN